MKVGMVSFLLVVATLATPAWSAVGDFRVGTFDGVWCNYQATYFIEQQHGDEWTFSGRVLIEATGQYDRFWVKQYANNRLRMVRYLSGQHTGRTQIVDTYPPETQYVNGQTYSIYSGRSSQGIGCGGQTSITVPES